MADFPMSLFIRLYGSSFNFDSFCLGYMMSHETVQDALTDGMTYIETQLIAHALGLDDDYREHAESLIRARLEYNDAKQKELSKPEWDCQNSSVPPHTEYLHRMVPANSIRIQSEFAARQKLNSAILAKLEKIQLP